MKLGANSNIDGTSFASHPLSVLCCGTLPQALSAPTEVRAERQRGVLGRRKFP